MTPSNLAAAIGALVAGLCSCASAAAQQLDDVYNPRTTYGEVGLLDMPSARMAPDGQLSFTIGAIQGTRHYDLGFQFLPWLEASFRYSHITKFDPAVPFYDRSFGLKVRLFQETETFPELSIGLRDLLGTGVYSGEYLVASKRLDSFDFTLGTGWGRLAQSNALPNPLAQIFPSFAKRQTTFGEGGNLSFGQYFHGPKIGLFGGAIWRTPIEDADVIVEYSSDRYTSENAVGSIKIRSPVNIGLSYRLYDVLTVSAGWYYGTSYGLTLSLTGDTSRTVAPQRFGPQIPPPVIRSDRDQIDALSLLLNSRKAGNADAQGMPWVNLPNAPAGSTPLELVAALTSERPGVRDVELMGTTLLVDTHFTASAKGQCDSFKSIVSSVAPRVQTIAISDFDDPSGKVAVCAIRGDGGPAISAAWQSPEEKAAGSDAPPIDFEQKIRDDVSAQSLQTIALSVEPTDVWIYFSNRRYYSESEAAGRIARILMADAPPNVEIFHIISVRSGMAQRDFRIVRSSLERATQMYGRPNEMGAAVSLNSPPLSNPLLERAWNDMYPRIHWDIGPNIREGFFDPQRPLQFQLYGAINISAELTHSLSLESRLEANIFNTYNLSRPSNSVLPHVRTDIVEYLRHGINGVADLDLAYRTRVSRDFYFEAKAGYLEDMFAGAGMQVLWRPEDSRVAFGADLYQVWQRNFDRLFGLRDYHILTGHLSVYYDTPWYGLNLAAHAGRYLAGDYGVTFEVGRRFSTGVQIGAFATFTNVPFSKFGEGSFDKGIVIHIPLEWAVPFYTQSAYDLFLRSLTRDGGARLDGDDSLIDETRQTSEGELVDHLDEITAP